MPNTNLKDGESPSGRKDPKTPEERLLFALEFGLTRRKAREWAGMSKEDLGQMRDKDPTLDSKMRIAIAFADMHILQMLFRDSHWQAWRLIFEYRAGLGKKRLVTSDSAPPGYPEPPPNDPAARHLTQELMLIPPGKEHLARIVIVEPEGSGTPDSDVTNGERTQLLKT